MIRRRELAIPHADMLKGTLQQAVFAAAFFDRMYITEGMRLLPTASAKAHEDSSMFMITLQEAQATLMDLIHRLTPGEEVLITENERPVANPVMTPAGPLKRPRVPGTLRGSVLHMAPAFNAPLDDFKGGHSRGERGRVS
jgi:antitoxin (DNA-binding transcriptional repressor) of toxin-antitoxin stability system